MSEHTVHEDHPHEDKSDKDPDHEDPDHARSSGELAPRNKQVPRPHDRAALAISRGMMGG